MLGLRRDRATGAWRGTVVCHCRRFLRGSLALTGFGLLAGCSLPAFRGQQSAKVPRIGLLLPGAQDGAAANVGPALITPNRYTLTN
jgi:hypothetical protein